MSAAAPQKLIPHHTPLVILAEGCFGTQQAKTASGVIRYGEWPITSVIDSQNAGKFVNDILTDTCTAPIVSSLSEALSLSPRPQALLIGTAPMGGGLPDDYRLIVKEALEAGLHIISGLHIFLNQQPDLVKLAQEKDVLMWDVRATDDRNIVTRQLPRASRLKVITMVGTDCSVGKMYTALELTRGLKARNQKAGFLATGQTGIMISGRGVPLDRIIGDFMAGTLEEAIDGLVREEAPDWVMVEGQGSLIHPAYSGVTMSLIHGSAPDGLILCHNPRLTTIRNFETVPLPPLGEFVKLYESAAGWIKPANVLGIAMNTASYSDEEAKIIIARATAETGLPATDPVRFGVDNLISALESAF